MDYVIVSPVRNEADFLPSTIESISSQTILPRAWIIVDDGSKDDTARIAEEATLRYPWIRVVRRPDRGFRQAGSGVMEAFYDGYQRAADLEWEFLVKLDGDVSFAPDYFARCFERFSAEPKLGIAGGTVCARVDGRLEPESRIDPRFHVRGATKIYRRACWDAIGGLIRQPGWDTLDEVKANMLGWSTRTLPGIEILHHRPAGEAYGTWSNWTKNGRANYVVGYHPVFMLVKCLRRMWTRPYVVGGLGLLVGFFSGYTKGQPQTGDREVIRYFRQQQMNRLFGRRSLWDQE